MCWANHQLGRCQCGKRLPSALVNVNTRPNSPLILFKVYFCFSLSISWPFHSLSCLAVLWRGEERRRAASDWQQVWYHISSDKSDHGWMAEPYYSNITHNASTKLTRAQRVVHICILCIWREPSWSVEIHDSWIKSRSHEIKLKFFRC